MFEELADDLIANGVEESRLAREFGHVDSIKVKNADGNEHTKDVPYIAVAGDGGWGKRSFKHSLGSLSGAVSL